jgi:hypothetical protein
MRHGSRLLRVFMEPTARPSQSLLPVVRNLDCILLGLGLLLPLAEIAAVVDALKYNLRKSYVTRRRRFGFHDVNDDLLRSSARLPRHAN